MLAGKGGLRAMGNEVPEEQPITQHASASFGKYQLFASLGRGGMADVFLAVARGPMGFNKLTVIKRLRTDLASDPSFLNMLLDEARLAARLSHPNVVHTYEVGEHLGAYFIAMEYLDGQPLNKVIKAVQKDDLPFDARLSARVVADALGGLHHAHELRDYDGTPLKIIHRDVSPHNIFVTYDGQVKLMDFGIAKAASSSTQTEVGVLKGKVAYMAPEQATGGEVDRRADIFSMGIVLWEVLTRQRLFSSPSAAATLHKLMTADVPRVSSVVPDIDPALDDIVAKALMKAPADRYQTAQEMRNALEAFIAKHGLVRQEDIGDRLNAMFGETRHHVSRQIQAHMGAVGSATNTGELMALNADSLKRFEPALMATPSGRGLLELGGSESGSGSGVVSAAHPDAIALPTKRVPTPPKKSRGAVVVIAVAAAVAAAALVVKCTRDNAVMTKESPAPTPTQPAPTPPVPATQTQATQAPAQPAAPTPPPAEAPAATTAAPIATQVKAPEPTQAATRIAPSRAPAPAPAPAPAKPPPPAATQAPAEEGTGFVTLDTYPWTKVSEGGKTLGVTPLIHVPLSAGAHTLTLENPDQGIKQSYPVTVKAGETVSRRLGLK